MTIKAFTMKLLPGTVEEYRKRHDEIWPELSALLRDGGIYDYSIFLDEASLVLFACLKLRDGHTADELPHHPLMQKWWDYMAPLMETEPSNRPVEIELQPMFRME